MGLGPKKIKVARGGKTKDGRLAKVRPHTRKIRRRPQRRKKSSRIAITPSTIRDFANHLEEKYTVQVDIAIEKAKTRFTRVGKPLIKEKVAEEAVKVLISMGVTIKYPTLAKFAILAFLG